MLAGLALVKSRIWDAWARGWSARVGPVSSWRPACRAGC